MDLFKNNVVAGVGLAFAATVLAPIVLPAMGRVGRPLAKSLVRGGMMMYEKGREAVAVAGESVEDLMAEIRAETRQAAATSTAPQQSTATPAAQQPVQEQRQQQQQQDRAMAVAPDRGPAPAAQGYSGNGAEGAAQARGAISNDPAGNI